MKILILCLLKVYTYLATSFNIYIHSRLDGCRCTSKSSRRWISKARKVSTTDTFGMVRIMMSMMGVMVGSMVWIWRTITGGRMGNMFDLVSVICAMREIGFSTRMFEFSRGTISRFWWAIARCRFRGMIGLRLMVCRFGRRSIRFRCMIWFWFMISRSGSMVWFRGMDHRRDIGCRCMIGFRFDGRYIWGRGMIGFRGMDRWNIGSRSMVSWFRSMVRFWFHWRDIGWDDSMNFRFGFVK